MKLLFLTHGFFRYLDVTPDVVSASKKDPNEYFEVEVTSGSKLKITPTEALKNYYSNPNNLPQCQVTVTFTCTDTSRVRSITVTVIDTDNNGPVFSPASLGKEIKLPFTGAPINFDTPIRVTDLDFESRFTSIDFSLNRQDILDVTYERVPSDLTARLEYYDIKLYLLDTVTKPEDNVEIVLKAKGSDSSTKERDFPINLKLIVEKFSPLIILKVDDGWL